MTGNGYGKIAYFTQQYDKPFHTITKSVKISYCRSSDMKGHETCSNIKKSICFPISAKMRTNYRHERPHKNYKHLLITIVR